MDVSRRNLLGALAVGGAVVSLPAPLLAQQRRFPFEREGFPIARNVGTPNQRAVIAMYMVCDAVGISRDIQLRAAEITENNTLAYATTRKGTRYIVYDRERVRWPERGILWEAMIVIAHEVGHHAQTHNFRRDRSDKNMELDADRFSGFALSRLGATEAQALSFFSSDWPASRSHPSAARRREATREGWRLGERMKRREQATGARQ